MFVSKHLLLLALAFEFGAAAVSNQRSLGARLEMGDELTAFNFRFVVQSDCNLVIYNSIPERVMWASGTSSSKGCHLSIQNDCNVALYESDGALLWRTATNGKCTSGELVLGYDGRLVLEGNSREELWESHRSRMRTRLFQGGEIYSENEEFRAILQDDCNLVVYASDGDVVWSTGTRGEAEECLLVEQTDGNVVLYGPERSLWNANTRTKTTDPRVYLNNRGTLLVYDGSDRDQGVVGPVVLGNVPMPDYFSAESLEKTVAAFAKYPAKYPPEFTQARESTVEILEAFAPLGSFAAFSSVQNSVSYLIANTVHTAGIVGDSEGNIGDWGNYCGGLALGVGGSTAIIAGIIFDGDARTDVQDSDGWNAYASTTAVFVEGVEVKIYDYNDKRYVIAHTTAGVELSAGFGACLADIDFD